MLDMIDVMINRASLLGRTDQDRVDADHAAALADRFDLIIADVPLHVVEFARVGVRNDQWLFRKIDNFGKA